MNPSGLSRCTRSLTPALLVALSLGATASIADAAQPPASRQAPSTPARDRTANVTPAIRDNAALIYYSVWMNDTREQMTAFGDRYSDMVFGKALPQAVADFLKLRKDDINRLVRAGKMKHCDFGVDRSEGFNTVLPHLAKLRSAARMLNADAERCLLEGKPDDAADRYVAIFGLARHSSGDRILISSLVGIAIANVPVSGLVEHKGATMLTPAGRAKVLAVIEKFDGGAGFKLKDSLEGEREMAVDATVLKYGGPDAGRRFADEVLNSAVEVGPNGASPEGIEKVRQMDEAALHAEARKLNAFYDAVLKVWDTADANTKLKELAKKAEQGDFGAMGPYLLPALTKCHVSEEKGAEALQKIAAALRQADAAADASSAPAAPANKSAK